MPNPPPEPPAMCITCGVRTVVPGTTLCRACGNVADKRGGK